MDRNMLQFYKAALQGAITNPLCAEYKNEWRACGDDKERLMRLGLRQQSLPYVAAHAYNGMGLTKEYIKKEFKDYINGYVFNDCDDVKGYTYGLYVDWKYKNDLDVKTDVVSIMWTVGANIVVPRTKAPTIYISNGSKVHLVCNGYNCPRIYLFDDSKVILDDVDEDSRVIIYKYSDNAQVEIGKYCLGEVKTFNKELRL